MKTMLWGNLSYTITKYEFTEEHIPFLAFFS